MYIVMFIAASHYITRVANSHSWRKTPLSGGRGGNWQHYITTWSNKCNLCSFLSQSKIFIEYLGNVAVKYLRQDYGGANELTPVWNTTMKEVKRLLTPLWSLCNRSIYCIQNIGRTVSDQLDWLGTQNSWRYAVHLWHYDHGGAAVMPKWPPLGDWGQLWLTTTNKPQQLWLEKTLSPDV